MHALAVATILLFLGSSHKTGTCRAAVPRETLAHGWGTDTGRRQEDGKPGLLMLVLGSKDDSGAAGAMQGHWRGASQLLAQDGAHHGLLLSSHLLDVVAKQLILLLV